MITKTETKTRFKMLDGVTFLIIFLKLSLYVVALYNYLPEAQEVHGAIFDKLTLVFAIDFTILGLAFLVTELVMMCSIKEYFFDFYNKNIVLLKYRNS